MTARAEKYRRDLLEGSIVGAILKISLPIIAANVLQTVYQLIDTFWVGRLGTEAVAAVSLSFPILFLLMSIAIGFSMAGSIFVAQYNGKGDTEKMSLAAGQTMALTLLGAILISLLGFFSSEWLLKFFTRDPAVLLPATDYLKISFTGMAAMFVYFNFQASYRGIGEVKIPMYIILATVIINFFIDPLFMFGWGPLPALGVAGVALATVVTEILSAIIAVVLLTRGRHGIKLHWRVLKLRWTWVKKLTKLGVPSSLEHSSRSLGMVAMTFIVAYFGTLAVASFGVGTRILSFIIIPAIGFSIATSSLVGNNLGARQPERAKNIVKTGMKIGFGSLTAAGIMLFWLAPQLAAFFVPGETALIQSASLFLRIMALTFGFIGIQMVVIGTLKAAGKTTSSMFLALFNAVCLVAVSLILGLSFDLKELGVWIAYPVSNILSTLLAVYFYWRKDRLKKELV